MRMKGKLLTASLAVCLVLTACHGRMPPPVPSESAGSSLPASAAPQTAPADVPASTASAAQPPESVSEPDRPAPSSSSAAPAESAADRPVPEQETEGEGEGGISAPEALPPDPPPEEPAPPPDRSQDPAPPAAPEEEASSQPPAPGEPELPEGCRWQDLTEAALLTMINKERVRQQKVPLTYDPDLSRAARLRAEELFRGNYVAHTRPDGSPWETVLSQVSLEYAYAGENLAWSNHAPEEELGAFQWFSLWKESRSHLAAMVGDRYTHCGVAVLTGPYYEGEAQSYAVAVFCSY